MGPFEDFVRLLDSDAQWISMEQTRGTPFWWVEFTGEPWPKKNGKRAPLFNRVQEPAL